MDVSMTFRFKMVPNVVNMSTIFFDKTNLYMSSAVDLLIFEL